MTIAALFWLVFILSVVIGGYANRGRFLDNGWYFGSALLLYVLLFLIGWRLFGFIVQG